jgi:hypothetical protein
MSTAPARRSAHRRARRRGRVLVALVAAVLSTGLVAPLAGCSDLRPETPAPTEPSPDDAEVVRAGAVADSLTLADLAQAALRSPEGAADGVATALSDASAFSLRHADALGGVYDSGLPDPTPTPTPTGPLPSPTTTAAPTEVLTALGAGARDAFAAAGTADDGAMALLLASIGTAREALAVRLAAALGAPVPEIGASAALDTGSPDASPTDPAAVPTTDSTVDSTAGATTGATADAAAPATAASGEPAPSGTSPAGSVPAGLARADASALVRAHDEAGYGFEVIAARLTDAPRADAVAAAARHRTAAATWAARAALADTADDPRRAVYDLPPLPDAAAAVAMAQQLETAVGEAAAVAVTRASAGARGELVDELRAATAAAAAWGAPGVAFPGMPELAG